MKPLFFINSLMVRFIHF